MEGDQDSVLLMDEAEDVFGNPFGTLAALFGIYKSDSKSKLFFHKLLESNNVPAIWICNSIHGVDPAHLRRFSYALNLEAPDESVQAGAGRERRAK